MKEKWKLSLKQLHTMNGEYFFNDYSFGLSFGRQWTYDLFFGIRFGHYTYAICLYCPNKYWD